MASRFLVYKLTHRIIVGVTSQRCLCFSYPFITNVERPCRKLVTIKWNRDFCTKVYNADDKEIHPQPGNSVDEKSGMLLHAFDTLKMKQERLGPVTVNDIRKAVISLRRQSYLLNEKHFLELLQFTLQAIGSEYRKCSDIVQEVWNLNTHKADAKLESEHIVLYLRMCLLAGISVSSRTMFKLLDSHAVDINRELLEVMMLILGRNGKLEDVTNLLALMKERNIAITETIFCSLILAHGFRRSCKDIELVLNTMHSVQMTFSSVTYHSLMTAYAMCGDFQRVRSTVQEMNRERIALSPDQLKTLITDIVKNDVVGKDFENLDHIVSLFVETKELDLSTTVLHLIHHGHAEAAIKLLPSHKTVWRDTEFYNNARIYIQEMVHADTNPSLVVHLCSQLEDVGINKYALVVALEAALTTHKNEIAWALLKALKDVDKPLRPHYFLPLFCPDASQSLKSSELLENVRKMVQLDVPPDFEALRDFIIPRLSLKVPSSTELMLKNAGLTVSQIATPLLIVLIRNNMIDKAFTYAKDVKVKVSMSDVTGPLAAAWSKTPQAVIALLELLIQKSNMYKAASDVEEDWGGQFLLDITASRSGLNSHQVVPLFKEFQKHNIIISETSADYLIARSNETIQKIINDNIDIIIGQKSGQPPKEPGYSFMPHPNVMNTDALESHLVELRAKYLKTRGTLRRLILLHASQNDTQRVLELLKEMEESEEKPSPGVLASVLSTYTSLKNVNAALEIYQRIRENFPSFTLDNFKIIDFCTVLLENNDIQVAIEILENTLVLEGNMNGSQKQVRRNCRELLMAAAGTCNYDATKKIFTLLKSRNIIQANNLMLGALVKCRLNCGDLSAAVQEVKDIYKNFRQLPMKVEVLIYLLHNRNKNKDVIEKGVKRIPKQTSFTDSAMLEDMLNIIAASNGARNAQHDLLFACVEAGYPSEARQVLQALGKTVNRTLVLKQCDRYVKTNREEPLLNMLVATKAVQDINREEIFKALLDLYYIQNDGTKGLSLWIRMQEEDVLPSMSFLSTLASLLASNDISIPFEIPQSA